MGLKVNIHRSLRHLTNGQAKTEVNGSTVGQCLNDLVKQFPGIKPRLFDKKGRLLNYVDIYVNLESSYPEELAMSVKDGDRLHITLIIAGGVSPIFERMGEVLSRGVRYIYREPEAENKENVGVLS